MEEIIEQELERIYYKTDEDEAQAFFHMSDKNVYSEGFEKGYLVAREKYNVLPIELSKEEIEILNTRIKAKGATHQKVKVIEEFSELTKEICKDLIGADSFSYAKIIDEYADSLLMLKQLEMIYDLENKYFKSQVKEKIKEKLKRLEIRNKKYLE
jgi:hypothetical protein